MAEQCNYADYFDKFVTYPPTGLLPLPGSSVEADDGCDVWDAIFEAALLVNPAFDIYRIFDTVRSEFVSRSLLSDSKPVISPPSTRSCGTS